MLVVEAQNKMYANIYNNVLAGKKQIKTKLVSPKKLKSVKNITHLKQTGL
jgi:hypothetical protein